MTDLTREEGDLYRRVAELIEAARSHVARSVNSAMVHAYWHVGRELVEVEQQGKARAGYGDELIARLVKHLRGEVGKGFGARTLRRIRLFYLTYPEGSALPPELGGPEIRTALLSKSEPGKNRTAPLSKSPGAPVVRFPPTLSWTHYLILSRPRVRTGRQLKREHEVARGHPRRLRRYPALQRELGGGKGRA